MGNVLLPDDPWVELGAVEAEVASVSATLATLVSKMHALKARVNNLYSPFVRLLPPEIVSEIFTFFNPPFSVEENDITCAGHNPLQLGAVCSSWRDIAWSTPTLWATLTLHLTSSVKIASQIQLIEQWLARSGDLPLSIRLSASTDMSWLGTTSEGIIKAINQHSIRWSIIDIRFPSPCYKFLPRPDDPTAFPLLRSVSLKPPGGQSDREHRICIPNAPQLRHLTLSCLYLRSIVFHWEVVTSLDIESFYIDESLGMLMDAVSLVDLTLRRTLGGDDRHTVPFECIRLASLQTIQIINDKGTEMQTLLNKITTPQLRKLVYTGDGMQPAPSSEICALILRSECALVELSILRASLREEPLLALFSVTPSLITLSLDMPVLHTIKHTPLTDRILMMCNPEYTRANNMTCHLPDLQKLTYSGPQGFRWEVLRALLDARLPTFEIAPSFRKKGSRICISNSISCISDISLSIVFLSRTDALKQQNHVPDASIIKSYLADGIKLAFYSTMPEDEQDPTPDTIN